MNRRTMRARYDPHALPFRIEQPMLQKAPYIDSGILLRHVQPYEAITGVTESCPKEILISREEGDPAKAVKERDDIVILDAQV